MAQMGTEPRVGSRLRHGNMTATMRAITPQTGPKVLRIGVVRDGRVCEERVLGAEDRITVGTREDATFVLAEPGLPSRFILFERRGPNYRLNLGEGMRGRVALEGGITEIASASSLDLGDDARGKIVLGGTTLLFQLIVPPVVVRPQLPLSAKGGFVDRIDWGLTILVGLSFLLHFGFVGAMYSDWIDPPVDHGVSVSGPVDLRTMLPLPTPEPAPDPDVNPLATPVKESPVPTPAPGPSHGAVATNPTRGAASGPSAAALTRQADAREVSFALAFGGKSAVEGGLRRSEVPPVDLSASASSDSAVSHTGGELRGGNGGAPVQAGKDGLASLGGKRGSDIGQRAGKDTGPTGPAQAIVERPIATVPVSDADSVIAGLRPRFRSCYERGLSEDPSMAGKVVISAKISPNGEVASASPTSNAGLSSGVAECIARAVRGAQFSAPRGTGSSLAIPVTFVRQAGR